MQVLRKLNNQESGGTTIVVPPDDRGCPSPERMSVRECVYKQLTAPSAEATAVSTLMASCKMNFQVSFFIMFLKV